MQCLVTGVAGFIGSHLAERLLADGHDVVGVDCYTPYYARSLKEANLQQLRLSPRFQLHELDLGTADLTALLSNRDWIFHEAAQAGVRASWGQEFETYTQHNIMATQRLLEAARHAPQVKRFVYASSSSIYGNAVRLPVSEDATPHPISPYGVTKLAAEHLCSVYWQSFHVPTVALRYFTVYGPRQRPDMGFHIFGKALLEGQELVVLGDGSQTRDFTYISDIVEASVSAAGKAGVEGQVFNVAGGSRVSLRETIGVLAEVSGCESRVRYVDAAPGDPRDTYADITRAEQLLGYAPRVGLREGLEREMTYLRGIYPPGGGTSKSTA